MLLHKQSHHLVTPVPTHAKPIQAEPSRADAELTDCYQKLAGGSLLLAQQRADESNYAMRVAYKHLAHMRQQLRQLRKIALAG